MAENTDRQFSNRPADGPWSGFAIQRHPVNALRWVALVAALEPAATGVLLIVTPSLFAWLLLGSGELSVAGQALGRIAGIAMLGTGLASWPSSRATGIPMGTVRAMLIYNILATIYLGYLGLAGQLVGMLLWPAVVLHIVLLILLLGPGVESLRRSGRADVQSRPADPAEEL